MNRVTDEEKTDRETEKQRERGEERRNRRKKDQKIAADNKRERKGVKGWKRKKVGKC